MEKIYWEKLSTTNKLILILGWFNILNFVFWISLLIYHSVTNEKKFWTPGSYRVVYVFGMILFLVLIALLTFVILGLVVGMNVR